MKRVKNAPVRYFQGLITIGSKNYFAQVKFFSKIGVLCIFGIVRIVFISFYSENAFYKGTTKARVSKSCKSEFYLSWLDFYYIGLFMI